MKNSFKFIQRSLASIPGAAAVMSIAFAQAATAATIYDGFDYNTTLLEGNNGGTGAWTGAWVKPASIADLSIASPLTYPGLQTSGNAIADADSLARVGTRTWDSTGLTGNGDTLWFSTIFNTSATGADMRIFFFHSGTSFTANGSGLFVAGGADGNGTVAARIGGNTSSTIGFTGGQTNLVVGRITFSDTANADDIRLWVNPTLGGAAPADSEGVAIQGDIAAPSLVVVRGGTSWTGSIDEIRVGETFGAVTVPEPGSSLLCAVGLLTLLGRRQRR